MNSRNHPITWMFLALVGAVVVANVSFAQEKITPPSGTAPAAAAERMKFLNTIDYAIPFTQPVGQPTRTCDQPPTEAEILRALKPANSSAPGAQEKLRDNVRITYEKVVDKIDTPRFFPLVGMAQLHHCQWKCIVAFTETVAFDFPLRGKVFAERIEVVYLDKDHLHLVTETAQANDRHVALKVLKDANEIALLPTDTLGFVTIRVADLTAKLGLTSRLDKALPLKELKEQFGGSLTDVERCTMALFDTKGKEAVVVVRLTEKANIKEIHAQVKKKFDAVQIVDARTLLVASNEESLKRCGQQANKTPESEKDCAYALSVAANHDFFAWGRLSACPVNEVLPLPGGIECATVMVDVGDKLAIAVEVSCADEESALWTKKSLQAGLDVVRAQMLAVSSMLGAAELFPGAANDSDFKKMRFLPLKLMRLTEKGIQEARIEMDGTDVNLSISLPIDARMLRSEVAGLMRFVDDESGRDSFELPTFQMNDQCAGGKCDACPATTVMLAPGTSVAIGGSVGEPCGYPLAGAAIGCGTGAAVGGLVGNIGDPRFVQLSMMQAETLPVPRPVPNSYPSAMGVPVSYPSTMQAVPVGSYATTAPVVQVASAVQTARLSIANVRKEPALVFKMMDGGKLEFVRKLPAGEAVDIQTTTAQRWIAVFTDNPAGETFMASQAESVWLLRAAPQPQLIPAPPMPVPQPQPVPYPSYPTTPGSGPVPVPYPPQTYPAPTPPYLGPTQTVPSAPTQPVPSPAYSVPTQVAPPAYSAPTQVVPASVPGTTMPHIR